MKLTHQLKTGSHSDFSCWQFGLTPMPPWVPTTPPAPLAAVGDWFVTAPGERTCVILTDQEFNDLFRPLP